MKFIKKLVDYAPLIITGTVVLLLALMMFVVLEPENGFADVSAWVNAGFKMLFMFITMIIWVPEGKKKGAALPEYVSTLTAANKKMQDASQSENYALLEVWCTLANKENVTSFVTSKLAKKYGINYGLWCSSEEYRATFDGKMAAKVATVEKLAQRKVKPIKPTEVTSVSHIELRYDVENHTGAAERWKLTIKSVWSILCVVAGSFVHSNGVAITWNSVIMFVYWCIVILTTIFFSLRNGEELITVEHKDYLLRVIDFLSRFEAWKEYAVKEGEAAQNTLKEPIAEAS